MELAEGREAKCLKNIGEKYKRKEIARKTKT
jgi:hypothetical protein